MYKVNDLFNEDQLQHLRRSIENCKEIEIHPDLGRLNLDYIEVTPSMYSTLFDAVYKFAKIPLETYGAALCVVYSSEYGQPNLPPHFDGDDTEFVVDFQLESNTQWDVGVDLKTYSLEDNSAIIFNPNEHIHWRPHKEFGDGEYVKMMFFRFYNPIRGSDYSHLTLSRDDPAFDEVRAFRDSLS
jgi:hypothetical protein